MKTSALVYVTVGVFAAAAAVADGTNLLSARRVAGQVLTSTEAPALSLKFDKKFEYVGNQSFTLYDVAHAEQHFFVDADRQGRIKRLYWIQFEGYLPSNSSTYNYKIEKQVEIGGLVFIVDTFARKAVNPRRAGSDLARAESFLETKGYRIERDHILLQRLVHLAGEDRRNELMIIYAEDLGEQGMSASDVAEDGQAAAQWTSITEELLNRAAKYMTISR